MPAPARRLRSWLLLTACTAAVGAFWMETEARACSEAASAARKVHSCCDSAADASCCCQGSADERPAPGPDAALAPCSTADLAGRSSCACVDDEESSPADRPSRPLISTSDSRSSVHVAVSAILDADALSRFFAALRTPPFDPLGPPILLRTSRLRI